MDLTDEAITEFAELLIPAPFTTSTSASRVEILPEPCVFLASLMDRDRQRLRATTSARPEMPWSMPWYAEERSRTQAQVMSGVLTVHGSSPGRSTAAHTMCRQAR